MVRGFKSLKHVSINFQKTNVMIGINGAGKSNILKLFEFISHIRRGALKYYTNQQGGASHFTYLGTKMTRNIEIEIYFNNTIYKIILESTTLDLFQIINEKIITNDDEIILTNNEIETKYPPNRLVELKTDNKSVIKILRTLEKLTVFHFPDTTSSSGMKIGSSRTDTRSLKEDASNLASILLKMKQSDFKAFKTIEQRLSLFVPFFDSLDLRIDPSSKDGKILLEWRHKYNKQLFGPNDISDGTIRAIAILTAIYQNVKDQTFICIDEPELGLHPKAITFISETIRSQRNNMQILVATQSPKFLDKYILEEIIVVEYKNGESIVDKLDIPHLKEWLEDYSTGDLWEKNLLGGRP